MIEIWKIAIENDRYSISNNGRVMNNKTGRILKQHIDRYFYARVILWDGERRLNRLVHRLVAQNFLPNPENKPQVNHIDGNKLNNNVENLEWNTHQENMDHSWEIGLRKGRKGEAHHNSKLNESDILEIKSMIDQGIKYKIIAEKFKIHKNHITRIKAKSRWGHIK